MTSYYVDPTGGNDSTGDGSIGTPWASTQKALDTITPAGNGDQVNEKNGVTEDVLGAPLDFSTYSPSLSKTIKIRGYTSSENDGGIGQIDGDGTFAIVNASTTEGVSFIDMHLHNCGAADIITLDRFCSLTRCEIDGTTGDGVVMISPSSVVTGCNIHNIGGRGVSTGGSRVYGNYFANSTNKFTVAIYSASAVNPMEIERNIFSLDSSSIGIHIDDWSAHIFHNSILSSGSGIGIKCDRGLSAFIANNLVEGFSGAGFDFNNSGDDYLVVANNAAYNNGTDYANLGDFVFSDDNESLGASPFAKSGADTFANRFTYFAPVDTGNVRGGAWPSGSRFDKGAVQHADAGGGGGGSNRIIGG